jgi:hypothetical protein
MILEKYEKFAEIEESEVEKQGEKTCSQRFS